MATKTREYSNWVLTLEVEYVSCEPPTSHNDYKGADIFKYRMSVKNTDWLRIALGRDFPNYYLVMGLKSYEQYLVISPALDVFKALNNHFANQHFSYNETKSTSWHEVKLAHGLNQELSLPITQRFTAEFVDGAGKSAYGFDIGVLEVNASAIVTKPSNVTMVFETDNRNRPMNPGERVKFNVVSPHADFYYRIQIGDVLVTTGAKSGYFGPGAVGTTVSSDWITVTDEMAKYAKASFPDTLVFGAYVDADTFLKENGIYVTDFDYDGTGYYDVSTSKIYYATPGYGLSEGIVGSQLEYRVYSYYKNADDSWMISFQNSQIYYSARSTIAMPSGPQYLPSFKSFSVDCEKVIIKNGHKYAIWGNGSEYETSLLKPSMTIDPGLGATQERVYYQYSTDNGVTWWQFYPDDETGKWKVPEVPSPAVSQNLVIRGRAFNSRFQMVTTGAGYYFRITEFVYTGFSDLTFEVSRDPDENGLSIKPTYTFNISTLGGINEINVDLYIKRSAPGSAYNSLPDVSHVSSGAVIQNGIDTRLKDDAYTVLTERPLDWDTNYTNYYYKDESGNYIQNTNPSFTAHTYYRYTGFDITALYDIKAVFTDSYNCTSAPIYKRIEERTLVRAFALINLARNGSALAFGKISSNNENEFECALTAKFLSDVICGGKKLIFNDDNTVTWANA